MPPRLSGRPSPPAAATLEVALLAPGRNAVTQSIAPRADVTLGRSFRSRLRDACPDLPITWLLFAAFAGGTRLRLGRGMTACVDGVELAGRQDVTLAVGASGRIRVGRIEVSFHLNPEPAVATPAPPA